MRQSWMILALLVITLSVLPQAWGEEAAQGLDVPQLGARSDLPISIESEQLEATTKGGKRHFIFKGKVQVVQGDVTLRTEELEAFYPSGSSEPDRLVARKGVVMKQEGRTLRCDSAVYDRPHDQLTCTGNASMEQGADRLLGDKIEFEIEKEVVRAFGHVEVEVTPKEEASPPPEEPN